jgi:putative flippase GtrA
MRQEATRLMRFGIVGSTNTVLTLAMFTLLTASGVAAAVASASAFAFGAVNGYVLNRSWTFRARGGPATLLRYVAVQALGAACSAGGVVLATSELSLRRLPAECLVLPCIAVLTYTLSRVVVFHRLATVRE